jgi:hypothetical protein
MPTLARSSCLTPLRACASSISEGCPTPSVLATSCTSSPPRTTTAPTTSLLTFLRARCEPPPRIPIPRSASRPSRAISPPVTGRQRLTLAHRTPTAALAAESDADQRGRACALHPHRVAQPHRAVPVSGPVHLPSHRSPRKDPRLLLSAQVQDRTQNSGAQEAAIRGGRGPGRRRPWPSTNVGSSGCWRIAEVRFMCIRCAPADKESA